MSHSKGCPCHWCRCPEDYQFVQDSLSELRKVSNDILGQIRDKNAAVADVPETPVVAE